MTAIAQPAGAPLAVEPVDERLPAGRLFTLGLQHVLVMYAGAIAVPLIIGGALKFSAEQITMLISADLFTCGIVTLIQSFGASRWLGVKLPVMMGVTFAAVGPMIAIAIGTPGMDGARAIFGAGIGAGIVAALLAPVMSRLLKYFPPVVTGSIITIIGASLMEVGVGWAMGGPAFLAEKVDVAKLVGMVDSAKAAAGGAAVTSLGKIPMIANPGYGALDNLAVALAVMVFIMLLVKFGKGFIANIAVLLGLIAGCIVAVVMGKMTFGGVARAHWFDIVTPFAFGTPTFNPVDIITFVIVMIVVMIESTGMFLAVADIVGVKMTPKRLAAGLRVDGLGTVIGGLLNTFPHTSFSQNVGLVAVTGVKSRWVCVMGGVIMIVLGALPKLSAIIAAIPQFVLGGAGLVMFGMVAATGIRILSTVDYKDNRFNLYIVALAIGFGLIPTVAPHWSQQMWPALTPILHSGILLTSIVAVVLNLFFNGSKGHGSAGHGAH
ncbi:MAG: purine permease [Proteobacteria bacterium]|nr:purine permease [Pseudomonadota bacterium]